MSEIIFESKSLKKHYWKAKTMMKYQALDGFDMEIRRGDIYGFAGENGAGKTTLMRILTGRARQNSGSLSLFGKSGEKELCIQRGRIGALIEAPALYPGMTARDNLEVLRLQRGIRDKGCILEVLNTVGLLDSATQKARNFSLGMKQRLGLAMALLGNQEFLVLDEPMNGLDPEGILEFRELLKKLNRERGITILISSHLLGELNQLATCYGFIHKGKMVEQISAEKLKEKCRTYLSIRVEDAARATEALKKHFPGLETEIVTESRVHLYGFTGDTGEVLKKLVTDGVNVRELKAASADLEKYYMSVIKGGKL